MTELVLSKRPVTKTFGTNEGFRPVAFEQVVGVSLPASKPVWEYKYKPDGSEIEESLSLEDGVAERIADFYEQTKARKHEKRPFHNCHTLAWYAVGAMAKVDYYPHIGHYPDDPVEVNNLKAGQTYSVWSDGDLNHSLIGTHRPDYSLNVLGDYNPMMVIDNTTVMDIYKGTEIRPSLLLAASRKPEVLTTGLEVRL